MGGGEASCQRVGAQAATTRTEGGEGFDVPPPANLVRPCGTPRAPPGGGALARTLVHPAIQKTPSRAIRSNPFTAHGWHESRVGDLSAKPPWVSRARSEEHTSELQSHVNL